MFNLWIVVEGDDAVAAFGGSGLGLPAGVDDGALVVGARGDR